MSPTALMAVEYWFSPVVGSLKWRDLGSLGSPFEAVKSTAREKFIAVPFWNSIVQWMSEYLTSEIWTMPKSERKGIRNSNSSDFCRSGFWNYTQLTEIQTGHPHHTFYSSVWNRNSKFRLDFFNLDFRQKEVSDTQTVCKRDAKKLSEIQTSLDFRHSLYIYYIRKTV